MIIEQQSQNPYDWQLEITDPKLFAGRRVELDRVRDELLGLAHGPHMPVIAIVGERRVGKTSLILRIRELCQELTLLDVCVSLDITHAIDPWQFWYTLFHAITTRLSNAGMQIEKSFGFQGSTKELDKHKKGSRNSLQFEDAYEAYRDAGPTSLASHIIEEDLRTLTNIALNGGFKGVVLMFDEAHVLQDHGDSLIPRLIKQELKRATRASRNCALVFAGEPALAGIFTDRTEPFYAQGTMMPLGNFVSLPDITECAILPLDESEQPLMSPMTVDYLGRMSLGKPNIIRYICRAIYDRYRKGQQNDLSIAVELMEDVIENIESELSLEQDLKRQLDDIRSLRSSDLEILYNMTRYPNWSIKEIVELDESLRGERRSEFSIARRERILEEKRDKFVSMGLIREDPERCVLAGVEFVALYLRFRYEFQKYGMASKKLILGKGPPTQFTEKIEKLINALSWELRKGPGISIVVFHPDARESGETVIDKVKSRYSTFQKFLDGNVDPSPELQRCINECFSVFELVEKPGMYDLVCLSVRNLENIQELMQIELYFDPSIMQPVNIHSLLQLLGHQMSDARLSIEGADMFQVRLLDLPGLLEVIGAPNLDELLSKVGMVERWRLSSVRHIVSSTNEIEESERDEGEGRDDYEAARWPSMHSGGNDQDAEEELNRLLVKRTKRYERARLFNDRGYIRTSSKKYPLARDDLEMAMNLHYLNLPLTMLDLSFLDIIEEDYESAVKRIEDVLLLVLSKFEIEAGFLKIILPKCHLTFCRELWEQHPANLLEVAYINLAYCLLKLKGKKEALDILLEGLDLIPSSIRLKHALARYYLFDMKAPLANPLFEQLLESKERISDQALLQEINLYSQFIHRKPPRQKTRPSR